MHKKILSKLLLTSTLAILLAISNQLSVQALESDKNILNNTAINSNELNGWISSNNKFYYYKNGVIQTGWLYDSYDETYYLNTDGSMQTGWLLDEYGEYYYFNNNGTLKTGWLYDSYNETYYLNTNGTMHTGWLADNYGEHYYFNNNGTMHTGWLHDKYGESYYFNPNGTMMHSGDLNINGKTYSFNANGTRNLKLEVLSEANKHLDKPYSYGSTGPDSFDCSGFTSYVYKNSHDINIGRSTYDQMQVGIPIAKDDLETGDLVFTHPGHVGIYIGDNKIIHAPRTGEFISTANISKFYTARRVLY